MRKSSVAFSSGKSTSLRAALSAIVIAAVTLLSACDAWGTIDNPVDPQSPNYQGYPTVSNADEIKPATPINGEVFFACPTLVAYKVVGATSYDFQIRLSSNDWTATPAWQANGEDSNEVIPDTWTPTQGATYYWRVRATVNGTTGAWSTADAHFTIDDVVAPVITVFNLPALTRTSAVTLSIGPSGAIYATDTGGSGVKNYTITGDITDSGESVTVSASAPSITFHLTTATEGAKSITLTATDDANTPNTVSETKMITYDKTAPTVTSASFSVTSGWLGIDDTVRLSFTTGAAETGLTASAISVNGVAVTSTFGGSGTSYYVDYTVASGNTYRAESAQIPISISLTDAAGNPTTYTTSPSADASPAIDATAPTISGLSCSPSSGWCGDGDVITISITASESNLSASSILVNNKSVTSTFSGTSSPYSVTYEVDSGDADCAANALPVSIILKDQADNLSATYATSPAASPGIDTHAPSATTAPTKPTTPTTFINKAESEGTVAIHAQLGSSGAAAGDTIELLLGGASFSIPQTATITDTDVLNKYHAFTVDGALFGDEGQKLVSSRVTDAAGNPGTAGPSLELTLDKTPPAVSDASFNITSGYRKIDDVLRLNFTTSASETGLVASDIKVNDVSAGSTLGGSGTSYHVDYTVASGNADREEGTNTPVSILLTDAAGNAMSAAYEATPTGPAIDANAPVISGVSFSPSSGWIPIGDSITMTIDADAVGYTSSAISVNNQSVTGFTDNNDTTYTVTYKVVAGHADVSEGSQVPVSVVLRDAAGNLNTAYISSPAYSACPAIDAHAPSATAAPTKPDVPTTYINKAEADSNVTIYAQLGSSGAVAGDIIELLLGGSAFSTPQSATISSDDVNQGYVSFSVNGTLFGSDGSKSVSSIVTDAAGNLGTNGTALPLTMDTGVPGISSVTFSPSSGWLGIGDSVTITVVAANSETGLSANTIKVNNRNATGFTPLGGGSYRATYTVSEELESDRTVGSIPISIILSDTASNASATYGTSPTGLGIDAHDPSVNVTNFTTSGNSGYAKSGDTVTLYFSVTDNNFTSGALSATIGTQSVSVTNISGYNYSAELLLDSSVAQGYIPYTIDATDDAGNAMTTASGTSSIMYDRSTPAVSSSSAAKGSSNPLLTVSAADTGGSDLASIKYWAGDYSLTEAIANLVTVTTIGYQTSQVILDQISNETFGFTVVDAAGNACALSYVYTYDGSAYSASPTTKSMSLRFTSSSSSKTSAAASTTSSSSRSSYSAVLDAISAAADTPAAASTAASPNAPASPARAEALPATLASYSPRAAARTVPSVDASGLSILARTSAARPARAASTSASAASSAPTASSPAGVAAPTASQASASAPSASASTSAAAPSASAPQASAPSQVTAAASASAATGATPSPNAPAPSVPAGEKAPSADLYLAQSSRQRGEESDAADLEA